LKKIYLGVIAFLFITSAVFTSCSGGGPGVAKKGDIVQVNYTGTLSDGKVFDTNKGRGAFEFQIGNNEVIEGFENATIGMKIGEKKIVVIPSAQAYGPYRPELVFTVSKSTAKAGVNPEIGGMIQGRDQDGKTFTATITKIDGDNITVDANHRLAGKDLTFEIELLKIN
jgi:peptidylprolyl isomerase